jgi:integrase
MATVQRRGEGYMVEWYEPVTVTQAERPSTGSKWQPIKDPDDNVIGWRRYTHKGRTFPSREAAAQYARDVETSLARGERVARPIDESSVTVGKVVDAYVGIAANERTRKWRKSMLASFTEWAGVDRPIADLSANLIERYATSLPNEGRASSTRHRKVLAVETMWAWAHDPRNRTKYPGVPEPVRVTASGVDDVNAPVQAPPPVIRTAVPTIDDVDAMRAALRTGYRHGDAHKRVALITRYTGIRISQAVNLVWRDVHLDGANPYIVLRSRTRGAKKGRTRVIPLHAALVAEMAGWGKREGRVFEATNERWIRGEATREAFRTAWRAAKIDPAKWDVPDDDEEEGRGHGSPTHAIRAAVFTALLRAGVSADVASYAMGHATTATRAAYVPEASPEASPWWPALTQAIAAIPDHRDADKVKRLNRNMA